MSNALRQSQCINIRETNGNGNAGNNGGIEATQIYCIDLDPTRQEVKAELKSHTIMKVDDKIALGKDLLKYKDTITAKLTSEGYSNLAEFFKNQLPIDFWQRGHVEVWWLVIEELR